MSILRDTFIPYISANGIIAFEKYSSDNVSNFRSVSKDFVARDKREIYFYNNLRKLSNVCEIGIDCFQNVDFNIDVAIEKSLLE